mgnify:CR=1 FL=1
MEMIMQIFKEDAELQALLRTVLEGICSDLRMKRTVLSFWRKNSAALPDREWKSRSFGRLS